MEKSLAVVFRKMADSRVVKRCTHKLVDIVFIAFCMLLCNGEDFEDMVEFGKQQEAWLIGQQKVGDKTNEITAIPELLDTLSIQERS